VLDRIARRIIAHFRVRERAHLDDNQSPAQISAAARDSFPRTRTSFPPPAPECRMSCPRSSSALWGWDTTRSGWTCAATRHGCRCGERKAGAPRLRGADEPLPDNGSLVVQRIRHRYTRSTLEPVGALRHRALAANYTPSRCGSPNVTRTMNRPLAIAALLGAAGLAACGKDAVQLLPSRPVPRAHPVLQLRRGQPGATGQISTPTRRR